MYLITVELANACIDHFHWWKSQLIWARQVKTQFESNQTSPAFMPGTDLVIMGWSRSRTADTTIFIFGIQDLGTQIYYSVMSCLKTVDLVEDVGLMWPYI